MEASLSSSNGSFGTSIISVNYHDVCYEDNLLTPLIFSLFSLNVFLAIIYFLFLLYLFLGIAIVSDIFMCSIETITSQTRVVTVKSSVVGFDDETKQVKIWNDTVANLTLMALGSSAPEILLSIIEIVGSGFKAGDLGPGTIVGSAAFNLLIITAVCIVSLPPGQVKRITQIKVFAVTSFFSIFAYIWLFLILVIISPNVVELWEAILTFAFFPLVVILSYVADRNLFRDNKALIINSTLNLTTPDIQPKPISDPQLRPSLVRFRGLDSRISQDSTFQELPSSTGRIPWRKFPVCVLVASPFQERMIRNSDEPSSSWALNRELWLQQFQNAFSVNGANDNDNYERSLTDYIFHIISFHWKVFLACIPPPGLCGGWLTFLTSLIVIGVVTALVGDVASTFGCLVGLGKSINAITLIAMGTSLPDLFASRTAVRLESSADNAIGNVTGSNSVNVFLGLGLPWLMASIHWTSQGGTFVVPSGDLGFSVAVYSAVAIASVSILVLRRWLMGGEIGGSRLYAVSSSLILSFLWILYIVLSVLNTYGILKI